MSDDTVQIEIDGKPLQARKGQMIIQIADEAGVYIPRFCYHKKLSIAANCRMCLVEVEKAPKPMPACATPVMEGMKIQTQSKLAVDAQKGVMEFLLINHPLDCPICDQGGECELQDLAMGYGKGVSRYTENKRVVADENIGPLVSTDMTRCIHCTRCVRFGEEIAGLRELGATGRGEDMRIGTYVKKSMVSELSGNIIDICPVGALNNKPYRYSARAWELIRHPLIGPHDCVGSHLYLHSTGGKVKRAVPRENELINETWLADRDRFSCEAVHSTDRIGRPLIRRDGRWQEIGWDEALREVMLRLDETIQQQGAAAIGALLSPSTTLEEGYLLQKWLRGFGCHNIDHRVWQCDFSGDKSEPVMPWLGLDITKLAEAGAALLIASNIRKDQPMLSHRLRQAALKGAPVTFVNTRRYDLNFSATQQIVHPQEMIPALLEIVQSLSLLGAEVSPSLKKLFNPKQPAVQFQAIAKSLLNKKDAVVLIGAQAFLHPRYSDIRVLANEIARLTNARFGCLPLGANSSGLWLAGAVPGRAAAGKTTAESGLNVGQMFAQPRQTYILYGIDPECDSWNAQAAMSALEAARHVIAFSAFDNANIRMLADIILPLATFAEIDGSYVNIEGRWQSWSKAINPLAEARPGWKILRMLGALSRQNGFEYFSAAEICEELAGLCADIRLDNTVRQMELGSSPALTLSGGRLMRISDVPIYATDALVRRAHALQQTMDAKASNKAIVHPLTARQLGLTAAEPVEIHQDGEIAEFELQIDEGVPDGCVWTPLGIPQTWFSGPAYAVVELKAK